MIKAALVVFSLLCLVEYGGACTCTRPLPACMAYQETPVVFAGLVKSIDEQKVEINQFGKMETVRIGLTAHFLVEEPFKGINVSEVDVVTGGGGGDCGVNFIVGERYLVYAYKSQGDALSSSISRTVIGGNPSTKIGALSTSICSRTNLLSRAQDEIELLRALIAGKPQTRIFGSVVEYVQRLGTYEYNMDRIGPLEGLIVKAEGPQGKYDTKTDSQGGFRFIGVAPGKYKVSVTLPEGYGPLFDFDRNVKDVEVSSQGCSAEADFSAQIDGRISGRVFDDKGQPVNEQLQVSITTPESAGKAVALVESRSAYTDKNGRYEFDGLTPGRYVLGVSIANVPYKTTPFPRTYYPNGKDLSEARIIDLAKGQKLINFDFHLPPRLADYIIEGIALLADGKPAAGADVNLYDSEDPNSSLFGVDVKADEEGRFTVKGYKGRRYFVHAYLSENYFAGKGVQSEAVGVDTSNEIHSVKLILNKAGIFRSQIQ